MCTTWVYIFKRITVFCLIYDLSESLKLILELLSKCHKEATIKQKKALLTCQENMKFVPKFHTADVILLEFH